MIFFNKQKLHSLLCDFAEPQTKRVTSSKSLLRYTIEKLRGDAIENYIRMQEPLNPKEMEELAQAMRIYINTTQHIGNIDLIDNSMLHNLMCEGLLCYELDLSHEKDCYSDIIDYYFYKLNRDTALGLSGNATALDVFLQHLTKYPEFYVSHLCTRQFFIRPFHVADIQTEVA